MVDRYVGCMSAVPDSEDAPGMSGSVLAVFAHPTTSLLAGDAGQLRCADASVVW
jgi:hypothetical protein